MLAYIPAPWILCVWKNYVISSKKKGASTFKTSPGVSIEKLHGLSTSINPWGRAQDLQTGGHVAKHLEAQHFFTTGWASLSLTKCSEGGLWGYRFLPFFRANASSWWISDGICRFKWDLDVIVDEQMPQINPSNHGRYECTGPSASRISFSVKLATGHACRFYGFNKFNGFNRTRQCKLYKVVLPSHKVVYNPHENYRYIMHDILSINHSYWSYLHQLSFLGGTTL